MPPAEARGWTVSSGPPSSQPVYPSRRHPDLSAEDRRGHKMLTNRGAVGAVARLGIIPEHREVDGVATAAAAGDGVDALADGLYFVGVVPIEGESA